MKKILLSVFSIAISAISFSQCTEIFISEYVEGSNNNKAIELYNPTSSAIDLSAYELRRYSNGSTVAGSDKILALGGSIPAQGTYVIVIDRTDTTINSGTNTHVWECLMALADTFMSSDYNVNNVMNYNGNDVLALLKGSSIVDFFGVVGQDPSGGAWPDSNSSGGLTKDHSLIRKESIQTGITTAVTVGAGVDFDPRIEWYDAGRNRFYNLGSHDCACHNSVVTDIDTTYGCNPSTASVFEIENVEFSVYPNPVVDGKVSIQSAEIANEVSIVNMFGTLVSSKIVNSNTFEVSTEDLSKGMYFVSIVFENGRRGVQKISIK